METLKYNQDGNSGFIIESETNNQVAVVWTDTEDEEKIKEAEKLTKLFVASPKLLKMLTKVVDTMRLNTQEEINLWKQAKNLLQETLT